MSLASVQLEIETRFAARQGAVSLIQADYFSTHGKYFQGLWSHTVPPTIQDNLNGATSPDNYNSHPTDQDESWSDLNFQVAPMIWREKFDILTSPAGVSRYAELSFIYASDGLEYQTRIWQEGPDIDTTYPWTVIE